MNIEEKENTEVLFKKGSKLHAVNYHHVSLRCKLFEYIICKHILVNIEHKFSYLQHGVRKQRKILLKSICNYYQSIVQMHKNSQIILQFWTFHKILTPYHTNVS